MRQPKPFFRKQTKSWYVQIAGRQVSLGRIKEEAFARYHELMSKEFVDINYFQSTIAQLLDVYLDWCEKHRSEETFNNHLRYCRSFVDFVGRRTKIRQLKPKHLTDWTDKHPAWSSNSVYDAISIIQRGFNWAVEQGLIDRSPIARINDKPSRTRREVVYSPDQVQKIFTEIKDSEFKDLVTFLWETGCRPKEASVIKPEHIDVLNKIVVLPTSLNKTKKGVRVIFLNEPALAIIRRRVDQTPQGATVFRNRRGNAWDKNSMNCRFQRLRKKLGFQRLCAYGFRHSFATEGLKNQVDPISLSILMGHSDTSMIARTYQHLSKNPEFLLKQANKAKGVSASSESI